MKKRNGLETEIIVSVMTFYVATLLVAGYLMWMTFDANFNRVPLTPPPKIDIPIERLVEYPNIIEEQPILDPLVHSPNELQMEQLKLLVEDEIRELEQRLLKN
jgi:hypothetical protein